MSDYYYGAVARNKKTGETNLKRSFFSPFTLIAFMVGLAGGRILEKVLK